jgi:predicted cupin superfamily sugar epimerase
MIDTDFHNVHTPDAGRRGFEAQRSAKTSKVMLMTRQTLSSFLRVTIARSLRVQTWI